jgi:quinol-cytochrome oxidoreductase complex cytochrome b subunit
MQDFWLLNGFFLALGLIHIIISLIFIFSSKPHNSRNRSKLKVKSSKQNSKKFFGYNLLVSGFLISFTAALILIFGASVNLLVLAAINLAVTFIALRLNLFHDAENAPMPTIRNNENEEFAENASNRENNKEMMIPIATQSPEVDLITEPITYQSVLSSKSYIQISPELFAELIEVSNDPTAAVDEAIRWWLRRRLVDDDSINPNRKNLRSSESWRVQQQSWND